MKTSFLSPCPPCSNFFLPSLPTQPNSLPLFFFFFSSSKKKKKTDSRTKGPKCRPSLLSFFFFLSVFSAHPRVFFLFLLCYIWKHSLYGDPESSLGQWVWKIQSTLFHCSFYLLSKNKNKKTEKMKEKLGLKKGRQKGVFLFFQDRQTRKNTYCLLLVTSTFLGGGKLFFFFFLNKKNDKPKHNFTKSKLLQLTHFESDFLTLVFREDFIVWWDCCLKIK